MFELILIALIVALALIVLIVAIPMFTEHRQMMRQFETPRYVPDPEYQEAVRREARYFHDHPDEWID
jgi:hypothetical protein